MKKFMSTVALTLVAAVVLSLFSFPVFANSTETTVDLVNVTFDEQGYTVGEEVQGNNGWTRNWAGKYGTAVVATDPTDSNNKVLKLTTEAGITYVDGNGVTKNLTTAPLYTLGITDNSSLKKLNVSYRIKMIPYDNAKTPTRASWGWKENFGSLNLSDVDGEAAALSSTARFMFNGNDGSSNNNTTLNYYQYKNDGSQYSTSLIPAYSLGYDKTSIYNSWALVNEYIDLETNEYKFTITYLDDNKNVVTKYVSPSTNTLYFQGTKSTTIDAYDKVTGINFGILPVAGTGILIVDDIRVTKYADFTANLVSDTVTPNKELAIQFSNTVDASTVSAADFVVLDAEGTDVTSSHPISVRTDGKTVYAKIAHLAFDKSYKLTVSNANISDIYDQKLSQALEYDLYTDSKIMDIVPVASVTFDEEGYNVGESVINVNNWTRSLKKSNDDTAKVVTDPDDSSNKVLEIYATAKSDASSTFKYSFNDDIPDDNALLRVSYRMKMPDASTDAPYKWEYAAKLGTLNAVNVSSNAEYATFSHNSFNNNAYSLISHYYNESLSQQCPTYDISPVGGWIEVVKYIDFSTNKQRIEFTKYYGDTLGLRELWTTSYAGKPANKYDVVNGIFFSIDPRTATGYATEARLYVDDIEISRVPKHYIVDVDTQLSGTTLNMSAKVGRPGYIAAETNSLIFAVMDADTNKLVKAVVKPVDYKTTYTSYTKGSGTTFVSNPSRSAYLLEADYTATAEDITGNVYVKAFLWKDISDPVPYAASVTK